MSPSRRCFAVPEHSRQAGVRKALRLVLDVQVRYERLLRFITSVWSQDCQLCHPQICQKIGLPCKKAILRSIDTEKSLQLPLRDRVLSRSMVEICREQVENRQAFGSPHMTDVYALRRPKR